jgi:2-oxoisovalerate dehydrogenase E1 component
VINRAEVVDRNFVELLQELSEGSSPQPSPRRGEGSRQAGEGESGPTDRDLLELFESQMICRHIDLAARRLRAKNLGFYTIGSAGHEGNVVLGRLTRHTDPALLHYRSGAFLLERSRHLSSGDPVYETMLSFCASREDPVAGGRHKVWGSAPLWIIPQTSTIASHLSKAVGMAFALERVKRLKGAADLPVPADSVIVCSFGDASVNHSVAAGAFNAAAWAAHQNLPVPILWVCEDNGIGISVRTPEGFIESVFQNRPGVKYFQADGLDLIDAYRVAGDAVAFCRERRRPVFLHLKTVRLLGHAGSDVETEYHDLATIEATEQKDPLLAGARSLVSLGIASAREILDRYEAIRKRVEEASERAAARPKLSSVREVMAPLRVLSFDRVDEEARRTADPKERLRVFGALPERGPKRHLAVQINRVLADGMIRYPEMVVFGEDVAKKGGVYHVTAGLQEKFRSSRVFDTLLDETTILGLAQGLGLLGMLPVPEIQYLAYYHNAEDQIRGEACSTSFFSNGQFRTPMVVRIASWAYQKGFGGHFHNDNSIAALRDIPGIVIASPARGDDAAGMFRTCLALAKVDGCVAAFLEPIALYMTKDLHETGDGGWLTDYPAPGEAVTFGEPRVYHPEAGDLTILTWSNGLYLSLRAARLLKEKHGIGARVVDLRWLNPLNIEGIVEESERTGKVLVVDEGRRTGGLSEGIFTALLEHAGPLKMARVAGEDTYIPLGPAADHVLPSEVRIVEAARALAGAAGAEERRSGTAGRSSGRASIKKPVKL